MISQKNNPNLKIFFFDEARFGLHTSTSRCWGMKGKPLKVKVKQCYDNFYVYSSVSPVNGESFTLFLPYVNTEVMNIYLAELKAEYPSDEMIIIMDQAGWHKSKDLIIPDGIELVFLPPYSPELNPVERLWKFLKTNVLHNIAHTSINSLQDKLIAFMRDIDEIRMRKLCTCSYL